MSFVVDAVMVVSLLVTALFAGGALLAGHFLLGKNQPKVERWVLSWLVFDALIHFLLEGPFVVLSLTGTVNSSDHILAELWKEYGKADSRWLVSDPTVVSLEILTVVVDGLLCLVVIQGILSRAFYRHYAQLVLCVCELYGGWMTFCPEWLTGSKSLDTSNWMFLWVYLVFFNGLWVVVPLLLMYQTWEAMKALPQKLVSAKSSGKNVPATQKSPPSAPKTASTPKSQKKEKSGYNTRARKEK
ncbi:emopamil-binding protein-like [Physella acuta]|uniref:emopamil-binding protein-like n=1 Tax=Physella acuta TaxID=109671 RepID=UPI0027DB715B|nr:emopamil-binding protein-like [Physella acuta]